MITPIDAARAIRKANPYRKGKRVMVANYEIWHVGEDCAILHLQSQRWEIKEALLIHRSFGHRVIGVKLTDDKEVRLP